MLQQSTPFTWHFDDAGKCDLKIHYNRARGTYNVCRSVVVTDRCFEVLTLSTHQTLEAAVVASDALAAVVR